MMKLAIILVLALVAVSECFDMSRQTSSGYTTVRPGAHMFYWLYPAARFTGSDFEPIDEPEKKPLVLWLQGGPGGSSTGFGNFMLMGPLNLKLEVRNTSWLEHANLLFVDNPVGTGFSYVDDDSLLTTTNLMIGQDLTQFLIQFMDANPAYRNTPFYVFAESYGGKMAVGFAQQLLKAIASNQIQCDLRGIVLGDSWISPVDSVAAWPDYLQSFALIDSKQYSDLESYVKRIKSQISTKNFAAATGTWGQLEETILDYTASADFYNVLKHKYLTNKRTTDSDDFRVPIFMRQMLSANDEDELDRLMNHQIKKILDIPSQIKWGESSGKVFSHLSADFMRSVVPELNALILEQPKLKFVVYNGQLDLIVPTLGTSAWIDSLESLEHFHQSPKKPWPVSGDNELLGFKRSWSNLAYYMVLNAGHMLPQDAPEAGLTILRETLEV